MGVIIRDTTGKNLDDVISEIISEKAWAAVVVNSNATSMFRQAMDGNTGALIDGEYTPSGAVSLIAMGSRWFQVIDD